MPTGIRKLAGCGLECITFHYAIIMSGRNQNITGGNVARKLCTALKIKLNDPTHFTFMHFIHKIVFKTARA